MSGDEALDKFIAELLVDKDLSGIDDEARSYLAEELKDRLNDQINRALINELSEEKLDEFNKLLDDGEMSEDRVQQFMANSGVDLNRVVARTALTFRELYLQTPEQRDDAVAQNNTSTEG
jgi:hypothetical protein